MVTVRKALDLSSFDVFASLRSSGCECRPPSVVDAELGQVIIRCDDPMSHGGDDKKLQLPSGGTKYFSFVHQLNATDIAVFWHA